MTTQSAHRPPRTDTTAAAADVQTEVMRRLGSSRRMEIALEMSDEMASVARSGARARDALPAR